MDEDTVFERCPCCDGDSQYFRPDGIARGECSSDWLYRTGEIVARSNQCRHATRKRYAHLRRMTDTCKERAAWCGDRAATAHYLNRDASAQREEEREARYYRLSARCEDAMERIARSTGPSDSTACLISRGGEMERPQAPKSRQSPQPLPEPLPQIDLFVGAAP